MASQLGELLMGGDVPYPHGIVIRTCEEEEGGTSTTTAKYTTGIQFNNIKSHTINHELKFGSNNVAIADNSTTVVIFQQACATWRKRQQQKKRREDEHRVRMSSKIEYNTNSVLKI